MSTLTERMLQHAEQADWQAVAALESERSMVFAQLAKRPAERENEALMRDSLQQMLDTNERIRALVMAARVECGAALLSACTSSRLAQTYGIGE